MKKSDVQYAIVTGVCVPSHVAAYYQVGLHKVSEWMNENVLEPVFVGTRRYVDQKSIQMFNQKIETAAQRVLQLIANASERDQAVDVNLIESVVGKIFKRDVRLSSIECHIILYRADEIAFEFMGKPISLLVPSASAAKSSQRLSQDKGLAYTGRGDLGALRKELAQMYSRFDGKPQMHVVKG